MKRKQKCKVCGNRFNINRKDTYQVAENLTLVQAFQNTSKTFDAVDCPNCGCQCLLAERLVTVSKPDTGECPEPPQDLEMD